MSFVTGMFYRYLLYIMFASMTSIHYREQWRPQLFFFLYLQKFYSKNRLRKYTCRGRVQNVVHFVQNIMCWMLHDNVIKWKHFPRYWLFMREIHQSPVNSTKAIGAELWCFLWSAPEQTVVQQPTRRWFETPSHSIWRHCNGKCGKRLTDFPRAICYLSQILTTVKISFCNVFVQNYVHIHIYFYSFLPGIIALRQVTWRL